MASVSLPPRGIREWFQAYYILPNTDNEKILRLIDEMQKELGYVDVDRDVGEIGSLIAKFATITGRNVDGSDYIIEAKHQGFANLYRELEKRVSHLEDLEKKLNQYLGKNEKIENIILDKKNLIANKMQHIRKTRDDLLTLFRTLNFAPYNRIFQSAFKVFIFAPLQHISSILKTKKIETLALTAFGAVASYSIISHTHTSFLINTSVPIFFMYIGHVLSKTYYRLNEQPSSPQTFSFTISPPGSPAR